MIYIRIIFASIALFAVLYMIKFLNTQGIEHVPVAQVLLEQTNYPTHIALLDPNGKALTSEQKKDAWVKTYIDWCESRQTAIHYFQNPQNDKWSLTEKAGQWTIKQGQGVIKLQPVAVEKWLASNCHVNAFTPKPGFTFATPPLLPFHLRVVYVNKNEAIINTDGSGLFERDGRLYYSFEFNTALQALAQSASVNQ